MPKPTVKAVVPVNELAKLASISPNIAIKGTFHGQVAGERTPFECLLGALKQEMLEVKDFKVVKVTIEKIEV